MRPMETESASPAPPRTKRQLVILGSGTSTGVPMLGCDCPVCTSGDPRNVRTRPGALLRFPAGDALIDTGPELRVQMLRSRVGYAHAILYTHDHADHLFGLDDARVFSRHTGASVPIFCEEKVEHSIRRVFHYAFHDSVQQFPAGGVPKLEFRRAVPGVPFQVLGEAVMPIRLDHGRSEVLGFRVGDLAYCTDVKRIPEESWPLLEGLGTLVLGALRYERHPTHFSLGEALDVIARVKPARAYLTHLSHVFDHARVESDLPESVRLAYDGLALDF